MISKACPTAWRYSHRENDFEDLTPEAAAMFHEIASSYGRMPHEIASGILDLPGIRTPVRNLVFAVKCKYEWAKIQRQIDKAAEAVDESR